MHSAPVFCCFTFCLTQHSHQAHERNNFCLIWPVAILRRISLCAEIGSLHPNFFGSAQHPLIIGSAEALPILCVRYFRRERERERERYRERETEVTSPFSRDWRWIHTFTCQKFAQLAMSLHFPLPKIRNFRFSLHTSRLSIHRGLMVTIVALNFAMSSHFPVPKIFFALFVPPLSNGTSRTTSDRKPKTNDQILPSPMVHSSITDHILKRSSFWLALAMPLKFGIVGKLLVRRTRESFPFRERRWHIWITSSSQSASADWLSDSNGRSLWPISAAYRAAATTVSTVSTVIFAFFCDKWQPLSWVECLSGSHATLQRRRKGVNLQVAGFDTIFQRWTGFFLFYLLSFASLAFSVEELEPLIVIIFITLGVSCANWLDYYM